MKLLLTSAGLSTSAIVDRFLVLLSKPPKDTQAIMFYLSENSNEFGYIEQSKNELIKLGISNIVFINLLDAQSELDFGHADIIYICGGNTFSYLKRLRETGYNKKIIEAVKQGAVYVGVSAGSIIAGPSIEIAGHGESADNNFVLLKDLTGLCLTETSIFPHYDDMLHKKEVEEFRQKVSYPVITLTNEQALCINDTHEELVGQS